MATKGSKGGKKTPTQQIMGYGGGKKTPAKQPMGPGGGKGKGGKPKAKS